MAAATKPAATILFSAKCYHAVSPTSPGILLSNINPLETSVPLLFTQITTIFFATRIIHALLRPLGVPRTFSHVIAGILLGPSFLSRSKAFRELLFPTRSIVVLEVLAHFSYLLFLFGMAVKTDLGIERSTWKKAVVIGHVSCILPAVFANWLSHFVRHSLTSKMVTLVTNRWALASNPVITTTLNELNLLTSNLGRLAAASAQIVDLVVLIVDMGMRAWQQSTDAESATAGFEIFASFACYVALLFLVALPVGLWIVRRDPDGGPLGEGSLLAVVMLAIGLTLAGELIGQHNYVGLIFLGLLLPKGPPLGTALAERLDWVILGLFLPLYFAVVGYKTDVGAAVRGGGVAARDTAILIVAVVVIKFLCVPVVCLCYRMPFRDTMAFTLMINFRGFMEISFFNIWLQTNICTPEIYTVHIVAIVVFGGTVAALLKHTYKPSMRLLAYRRPNLQSSHRNNELRIMVCVHHTDNVPPMLTLLDISHPAPDAPVGIYLLHLSPLAGRASAVLAPYKPQKKRRRGPSKAKASNSDQIVKAFGNLEQHNVGHLVILPFVCIAPYPAMHNDVCTLALDKKVTLIILPFHKYFDARGTIKSDNSRIQAMNLKVLSYAPCSVAMLLGNSFIAGPGAGPIVPGSKSTHRVAVIFLGGADDREALAYSTRIAENPTAHLTVVRFILPEDLQNSGSATREELLDDEALEEFYAECGDNQRVVYRQETVRDGAGTVGVITDMCESFDLFIVGRRQGVFSPLTAGLELWSEFPELGVVGDILASSDFGVKVSTLVVQQQRVHNE